MDTQDKVTYKGIFWMQKISAATGEVLETYEDNNLIVTLGRGHIATLLGGTTSNRITKIAVGTNGALPVVSDSAITGGISKTLTSKSYPVTGTLQCNWSLETSEANGTAIREFGLLLDNDVVFARKTRDVINKDNTFRFEGIWKIIF